MVVFQLRYIVILVMVFLNLISYTTHHDQMALKLMKAYDFDTMLFPINWACYLKTSLGQKALAEAGRRNMGRIAIKALAHRAKDPKDDGYPKCWYRPIIDDPALADLALRFTLSKDIHTAVSPGDARMLELGLSIVEKYNGNPPPLSEEELKELTKYAEKVGSAIFAAEK